MRVATCVAPCRLGLPAAFWAAEGQRYASTRMWSPIRTEAGLRELIRLSAFCRDQSRTSRKVRSWYVGRCGAVTRGADGLIDETAKPIATSGESRFVLGFSAFSGGSGLPEFEKPQRIVVQ